MTTGGTFNKLLLALDTCGHVPTLAVFAPVVRMQTAICVIFLVGKTQRRKTFIIVHVLLTIKVWCELSFQTFILLTIGCVVNLPNFTSPEPGDMTHVWHRDLLTECINIY